MALGTILTVVAITALATSAPVTRTDGTLIRVDTFEDELGDGGGDCSLREAIQAANIDSAVDGCPSGSGADTVALPSGRYTLTLSGGYDEANRSGDLDISDDLIIQGAGAERTVIDGHRLDRVLEIHAGVTVQIEGVTVANGAAPGGDTAGDGEAGGGVYNRGRLTLVNSVVISNASGVGGTGHAGGNGGAGGGVYNLGVLTLDRSTVAHNRTGNGSTRTVWGSTCGDGGLGGGVYNGGLLTVTQSSVNGNSTGRGGCTADADGGDGGSGGGIYNGGVLAVVDSAVSDNATGDGGGGWWAGGVGGRGGGIYNGGTLEMADSDVAGNRTGRGGSGPAGYGSSGGSGGGIHNASRSRLIRSGVFSNTTGSGGSGDYGSSGGYGGGIYNSGVLTVSYSTVSHNVTGDGAYSHFGPYSNIGGPGGGVYNAGTLLVTHSAVYGNMTGDGGTDSSDEGSSGGPGGGLHSAGSLTVTNSTISSNRTGDAGAGDRSHDGYGGGISSYGRLTLESSTISANAAGELGGTGEGGGIYVYGGVSVKNTVIAGNREREGYGDCHQSGGGFVSQGYNLVEMVGTCSFTATGDITNVNPLLGPLEDNASATGIRSTTSGCWSRRQVPKTHALLPGSPAIDQGSCAGLVTDQRGRPRPADVASIIDADDGCDIGAYEVQEPTLSISKKVNNALPDAGQRITYTIVICNGGDSAATGAIVSDPLPSALMVAGPVALDPPGAGATGTPPILASGLSVAARRSVTLTFPVTVRSGLARGIAITNTAVVTDSEMPAPQSSAVVVTVRHVAYLPVIRAGLP